MFQRSGMTATRVLATALLPGCLFHTSPPPPLPMLKGPEAEDLIPKVEGWIVMDKPKGGIVALSLPSLEERTVIAPGEKRGFVHALSGPDAKGRIVFVEESFQMDRYSVQTLQLDGTGERLLFGGAGSPLWDNVTGSVIALHPLNGLIAFLGKLSDAQMHRPAALLEEGPLKIWSIEDGAERDTGVLARDGSLSWLPDGDRIAYCKLLPRDAGSSLPAMPEDFVKHVGKWSRVPAVHILDLRTKENRFVAWGSGAVPSPDGRTLLVQPEYEGKCRLVDLKTGESKVMEWPGGSGTAVAFVGPGLVLCMGLPTEGAPVKYTEHYSPLAGPRPLWSLKLVEISTGRFQTVREHFDPRTNRSFGLRGGHRP